jgi:uroporphyrinogen-III synthase
MRGAETMRVIVTRPQQEARQWVNALDEAGYEAVALPLIGVAPAPDAAAVIAAWSRLPTYDAAMFVSGNAVDYFFALKPAMAPVFTAQAATKTRAFVTGPGSHSALLRAHVDADSIDVPDRDAGQFDSEALWAVVSHRIQPGYRVLVVRGIGGATGAIGSMDSVGNGGDADTGVGRDWFANQVRAAGGSVDFVVAYQRLPPVMGECERALARQAAEDGSVWLFSSSEAIDNLVSACAGQSWSQARAVVTHPRLAQAAHEAGFAVVCESRPILAALMASIESLQ